MPPSIARALNEIVKVEGHNAYALRDLFPVNIDDIGYFDRLGRDGNWIVISKDLRNARKKAERAAILRNRIVAFYLSPGLQKRRIGEQAASILWHWDKILAQREMVDRGLFQLPENKAKFRTL